MMTTSEVISIHDILISRFGGASGLRDLGLLESALSRPFQTFDGIELHINAIDKASALIESLIINHPFVDGNKRIGYVVMRLFLIENDIDLEATQSEKYEFVIQIASGDLKFDLICNWIKAHSISKL